MKTTNHNQTNEPPGMTPGDIYFILFRHKWKIILLSLAGVAAAAGYWWFYPPPFQSEAMLFIRYVLDNRAVSPDAKDAVTSPDAMGQSIMNSEMEILSSYDVAEQVAKDVGPDKILAQYQGGNDPVQAADIIKRNLTVEAPKDSSVIHLVFRSKDPSVVQPVLSDVIAVYLNKYLQVHQSSMSDDFLAQETAELRSQIDQIDDELRAAKTGAGIISVADAEASYTDQIADLRQQLFEAEADLAAQEGVLKAESRQSTNAAAPAATPYVPPSRVDEYQRVCAHLEYLQNRQNQYFSQYGFTDENELVQEVRLQIAQTELLKKNLEDSYPSLIGTYMPSSNPAEENNEQSSEGAANVQPLSLQAKISVLKQELAGLQAEAFKVDTAETKIADLQRQKEMLEANYQYFATSLEQAQINETLGPGRVSNISPIEEPTPPSKDNTSRVKTMAAMIGGGIGAGLAWAFLIEFYLDTSVRRSKEIETRLKLPLLISIPDISRNGHRHLAQAAERRRLQFQSADGNGIEYAAENGAGILSWETSGCLNRFYDALRDRLLNYFESSGTTRSKLVAVTGTEKGCGVSAIAAGVAISLAEFGERVLLVDMKSEPGVSQQFFMGRPSCGLEEALESGVRDNAFVQENLYVVTAGSPDEKYQRILPRHFASLLPRLKASDYSYVIFDMPPVSQTSITSRLAGFMDMILLVIQAERTERDAAQQAIELLSLSKTKVGIVLNKTRKYIPDLLHRETLADF
ncbi:MAG TPA: Wzz/FepE/Etk N-terminal domain-containing protein [Verrucomicrobiae bacterium]|nr:Wzz/FepE/Etk N-terminal domain-containing protein [Verrucomicrobiae bacterium]